MRHIRKRTFFVSLMLFSLLGVGSAVEAPLAHAERSEYGPPNYVTMAFWHDAPAGAVIVFRDYGSGMASIEVTQSENVTTVVQPFTVGTTDEIQAESVVVDPTLPGLVTIVWMDVAGNSTVGQFRVDISPDTIGYIMASNPTAVAEAYQDGAVVEFEPPRVFNADADTVMCDPPNGSFFPIGTTIVTCSATNGLSVSFPLVVEPTPLGGWLSHLRAETINLVSNSVAESALVATVNQMQQAAASGNRWGVYVALVKCVVQVERYEDRGMLAPAAAKQLLTTAQHVRDSIWYETIVEL